MVDASERGGRRDVPIQLFTGKGGVGKTTLAAAIAVDAASRGQRSLIVELGHRASMEAVFGVSGIGHEPKDVGFGVHAMNIDNRETLIDYLVEHVRVRAIARRILANPVLDRYFDMAPAVAELGTLNTLRALARAERKGRPLWRPIIVDLDATGHALMLLEVPHVFESIARSGPLRRALDNIITLLTDPTMTVLHLVTLPAELPVQETIELYHRIAADGRVALGKMFVNKLPEAPITAAELALLQILEAKARAAGDHELVRDCALGRRAARIHATSLAQLERLAAEAPRPQVILPELAAIDAEGLGRLGSLAADGGIARPRS